MSKLDPQNGRGDDDRWGEQRMEQAIGLLLRIGVVLSALTVFAGAVIYLWHHAGEAPDFRHFRGEPRDLRELSHIVEDAANLKGRELIQFGLLLLIATPVMRVAFSAYAFMRCRDRLYVAVALLVLAILLFSLLFPH